MKDNKPKVHASQAIAFRIVRTISAVLSRLFPFIAVRWADRLFFMPHSLKRPKSEIPYYDSAEKSFYDFDGRRIALYEWGEGVETVILAHGWSSRGTRLGNLSKPLNGMGFRVVAYDMPAHGDSEGKNTNLLENAELLSRLYEKFAPVRAFIGHSFGGMVLSLAIHRHDLKVNRAVVISSPFTMDYIIKSFGERINITQKILDRMTARVVERFERLYDIRVFDLSPDRYADTLQVPFLIVHDRNDHEVDCEQGRGYAGALPNARLVLTDGLGHRRILRDEGVIKILVEFISEP